MWQLIRLTGGVKKFNRCFLERWGCTSVSRTESPLSYVAEFLCPRCGCVAFETFLEVSEPSEQVDRQLNLNGYPLWVIRWLSRCRHVWGGTDDPACVATPVRKDGEIVGMIEPVSPPPWYRYEKEGARGVCVGFGTLWQSMAASLDEFRLLAAIRADRPEAFEVKRK